MGYSFSTKFLLLPLILSSHFYSELIHFLEPGNFLCKHSGIQQTTFTDERDKLAALILTLKLTLFFYSYMYKLNYASENV